MIKKRIEITGKSHVKITFENYYNLHVNKENTCCKIIIPKYAILEKSPTIETKSVESESYMAIGDNVNVCLSGDIELNINCVINEINYPTDMQLELVCRIPH